MIHNLLLLGVIFLLLHAANLTEVLSYLSRPLVTGAATLGTEVVWARVLRRLLGSTSWGVASVLDSAAGFGIAHVLTIAQPDTGRPPRDDLRHPVLEDFQDLMHPPADQDGL